MKRLVIIVGMHRSGTSLVAQMCQRMGAYLGEAKKLIVTTEGDSDDCFENKDIVQINEEILRLCGKKYNSPKEIGVELNHNYLRITKAMEKMKLCIQMLMKKSDTVVIKDPRISLILPVWMKVLDEMANEGGGVKVHYIYIFRNPLEIADSFKRERGYSSNHIYLLWTYYNLSILKFLKGREYLQINNKDIEENSQVLEELSQLLGSKLDKNLKWELNHIIKYMYCNLSYSYLDVKKLQYNLLIDLYSILSENQERKVNLTYLEKQYMENLSKADGRYMDYEVLENFKCLDEKEIIIYGAGNYGKHAAKMLQQLGIEKFDFCDKDICKQGMSIVGRKVFSITEIEKRENILFVIAVQSKTAQKEIQLTLKYLKGANFLSYFTLKLTWAYIANRYMSIECEAERFSRWHRRLGEHGNSVMCACKCPILVYQYGKVGSSTVSNSLWDSGIENVHIHNFFIESDTRGKLTFENEMARFVRNPDFFSLQNPDYVRNIKDKMRYKKIITLVRDPIAVDLSGVFQKMEKGDLDICFVEQMQRGKSFLHTVMDLAIKMQDSMFEWFNIELKTLCDVDVYDYPFNKEKGYIIIKKDSVEILLIKAEKLSQMTEVLRKFIGNEKLELLNANVGKDKEYAHIYEHVKNKIKFPQKYIEHYYKNNPYMDHFYSKEEQKSFYDKWSRNI